MKRLIRHILLSLLTLCCITPVLADEPADKYAWIQKTKSVSLSGAGTSENPYLIQSLADLCYLQQTPSQWGSNKYVYFKQTADIDMEGRYWYPIGYVANPFMGNYNGDGHTIKNYKIDWSVPNHPTSTDMVRANMSYGLFGSVKGTTSAIAVIRNVVIEDATVTATRQVVTNGASATGGVPVIGLLVGNAMDYANVRNIVVRGCRIDDGDATDNGTGTNLNHTVQGFFVGGAIGKISVGDDMGANTSSMVQNICSNVDIAMTHVSRQNSQNSPSYALVGGVVGALNINKNTTGRFENTIYTGKINVPIGMVGPTFGGCYIGDQDYPNQAKTTANFRKVYKGYYRDTSTRFELSNSYYYGYKVYNPDKGDFVEFDLSAANLSDPSNLDSHIVHNTDDDTYTFGSHTANTAAVEYYTPAGMQPFQGVNNSVYLDINNSEEIESVLDAFNTMASNNGYYLWKYEDGQFNINDEYTLTITEALASAKDKINYSVSVKDKNDRDADAEFDFSAILTDSDGNVVEDVVDIDGYTHDAISLNVNAAGKYTATTDFYNDGYIEIIGVKKTDNNIKVAKRVKITPVTYTIGTPKPSGGSSTEFVITSKVQFKSTDVTNSFRFTYSMSDGVPMISTTDHSANYAYSWVARTITANAVCKHNASVQKTLQLALASAELRCNVTRTVTETDGTKQLKLEAKTIELVSETDWSAYGSFQWYGINGTLASDVEGFLLEDNTSGTLSVDLNSNAYDYYRVVWTGNDHTIFSSEFILNGYGVGKASKRVIYLYNKEVNDLSRKQNPFLSGDLKTHASKFTGKDRSDASYPAGSDYADGLTPYTAVKTMTHAYELLDAEPANGVDDNIVVVMGIYTDAVYLINSTTRSYHRRWDGFSNKPATITGMYGSDNFYGCLGFGPKNGSGGYGSHLVFAQVTKLEHIVLVGGDFAGSGRITTLNGVHANHFDITFGREVYMANYTKGLNQNYGPINNTNYPAFHFFLGYSREGNYYPENIPYAEEYRYNQDPKVCTVKIQSGCFGRIFVAAMDPNVMQGTFTDPHCVNVTSEFVAPEITTSTGRYYMYSSGVNYSVPYDVALITSGSTMKSSIFDAEYNIKSGNVGRMALGIVGYGYADAVATRPPDSAFGNVIANIYGGTVDELYGGGLGRTLTQSTQPYERLHFYGLSTVNLYGGEIKSVLYAAGAASCSGLDYVDDKGNNYHTNDPQIPYVYKGSIKYGSYEDMVRDNGEMPKLPLHDGTYLDLSKTEHHVNLYGGVIKGNLYGGGYGYTDNLYSKTACMLTECCGAVYGKTYITMQVKDGNVPKVEGHIYGGSRGSKTLYNEIKDKTSFENIPAGNVAAVKENYKKFARFYGESHINIQGGIVIGNVYGGGEGVDDEATFPEMAYMRGKTNVRIGGSADIRGSIYGGQGLADMTGTTNVIIEGGTIGNQIFGGSRGQLAKGTTQKAVSADIEGSTNVVITGGRYRKDEDYTTAEATNLGMDLSDLSRHFNIYGGGDLNCTIDGNTNLLVTASMLTSVDSLQTISGLSQQEVYRRNFSDERHRKYCVYGGGYGENTRITGNATIMANVLRVNNATTFNPSGRDMDTQLYPGQTFFYICGGGFAGNVEGNTNVTIDGYTFARRVYGGGMYGEVGGSTSVNFRGGSVRRLVGGGLLGDIKAGSLLTVGNKVADTYTKVTLDSSKPYGIDTETVSLTEDMAKEKNGRVYIVEDVYGANDVGGVDGYENEDVDGTIVHNTSADHGATLNIYGGHILGNVYGSGNGYHVGYYLSNSSIVANSDYQSRVVVSYTDGPANAYRLTRNAPATMTIATDTEGLYKAYKYRPRTALVNMRIAGNSADDLVQIDGNVYGGGNACTVGNFSGDPGIDPLTDPTRFKGGGTLNMSYGSHVRINGNVYMGNNGSIVANQAVAPADADTDTRCQYYYHYYDSNSDKFLLGFPNSDEGFLRYQAYMKLIDLNARVNLSFDDDATDLIWGSFYAGGARGSMTRTSVNYSTDAPYYHFTLPEGLTLRNMVVGGSEDAIIKYRPYTSTDCRTIDSDADPIYTYYGGIVGGNAESNFGGPFVWNHDGTINASDGILQARASHVVTRIDINCKFDPHQHLADQPDRRCGGIVYGGCYNSGIIDGSVEINCNSSLIGSYYSSTDFNDYLRWTALDYNVARLYGGGFGKESTIMGETFLNLKEDFAAFNVFGGGRNGDVTIGTNITLDTSSPSAIIYGSLYGGGENGTIGKAVYSATLDGEGIHAKGTNLNLHSGGADCVFGGSFVADIYGGTHINLDDQLVDGTMTTGRLMVGSLYGGNDVSGSIYPADGEDAVNITIRERQADFKTDMPGCHNGYWGYPLVGNLFAGGDGDVSDHLTTQDVTMDLSTLRYTGGDIVRATGNNIETAPLDLTDLPLPSVNTANVNIFGGTIIDAYGGGNTCTVTERTRINVQYADTVATAGYTTANPLIWGILRLNEGHEQTEISRREGAGYCLTHQIYRYYGGNNIVDMAIQPDWNLRSGKIKNVYAGGNRGAMTYPGVVTDGHRQGLKMTIDSHDIRIANLFGGGRMGNIDARNPDGTSPVFADDEFGATIEVHDGWIERLYGGNDVSGRLNNGVFINLEGGRFGSVYGAGNGNYVYKYDRSENPVSKITEVFDNTYGGRYFLLPPLAAYGGVDNGSGRLIATGATDEDAINAINVTRPDIDKIHIDVHSPDDVVPVYVCESLFCGGNSSTVITPELTAGDVTLNIGSNVILNRVFLGSDGASLIDSRMIDNIERVNGLQMSSMAADNVHSLLDRYTEAVDMKVSTSDFQFNNNTQETYIGTFCLGGNSGSMVTDKTITVDFPENITIFDRIVGGCFSASFRYKGTDHEGGMMTPIGVDADNNPITDKVKMIVRCKFQPTKLIFDEDGKPSLVSDLIGGAYPEGDCSIFGGCYNSGTTVGDISIDLYSNMLDAVDDYSVLKNSIDNNRAAFTFTGCGYGYNSCVRGNVKLRMMPVADTGHPSAGTIFGGSHNGRHIGNSTIEIRDGFVFNNSYGASRASEMYGSSQTIVGFPKYYVCNTTGEYIMKRADNLSYAATGRISNYDGSDIIAKTVKYCQGDIVTPSVVDAIVAHDASQGAAFDLVENDLPTNASLYGSDLSWNDIDINIGHSKSVTDPNATYYGGGGIYGGGQAITSGETSFAGVETLLRYKAEDNNTPSAELIGYGGNATIIIGDDPSESASEHITIGTGHYVPVSVADKVGTYTMEVRDDGKVFFVHQGDGKPLEGETYYRMETDGGVYGSGRHTFVQGFRAAEISNYGYATHTPQYPKLINTFQLMSMLTLNDCCLQLQGARDFTGAAIDATIYSIDHIDELRLNSSIDIDQNLEKSDIDPVQNGNSILDIPRSRNYMAFFNVVHYVGSIVTNTSMSDPYHNLKGEVIADKTYTSYKKECHGSDDHLVVKQRNLGTAPNMIGINNGYTLKMQNAYKKSETENGLYYGPILGVCEVKLLTLTEGQGGGYIYSLNSHGTGDEVSMQTCGNFVFPSAITRTQIDDEHISEMSNYIVDDCYPRGYANETSLNQEVHYWFVEGNRYHYNATLTAYTTNSEKSFWIDTTDNLIMLSGLVNGSQITVESIAWDQHLDPDYRSAFFYDLDDDPAVDSRDNYRLYLAIDRDAQNSTYLTGTNPYVPGSNPTGSYVAKIKTKFDNPLNLVYTPQLDGEGNLRQDDVNSSDNGTYGNRDGEENTPLLSIRVDDYDTGNVRPAFLDEHLREPEHVTFKLRAIGENDTQYEYTVNLEVKYLQGPIVSGNLSEGSCALPGEYIYVSAENANIDMDAESMWISAMKWTLHPSEGTEIDVTNYAMPGNNRMLQLPAKYAYNGARVNYEFEINGTMTFPVCTNTADMPTIEVHNYHRMKDVAPFDLQPKAGARVYIEDNADMQAFVNYVNNPANNSADGINFYLLGNVSCTGTLNDFKGSFHGNGYTVTGASAPIFSSNHGNIYNTGFVASAPSVVASNIGSVVNCFYYRSGTGRLVGSGTAAVNSFEASSFAFGRAAYELNGFHNNPDDAASVAYMSDYYDDGEYLYAYTTDRGGLRLPDYNGVPNYNNQYGTGQSMHVTSHSGATAELTDLFFAQRLTSGTSADRYPKHFTADARVYRAAGYYGSKIKDGFYFNRTAEVYNPAITAIDFTDESLLDLPTAGLTALSSFNIVSNSDNDHTDRVTKNLLVYTPADCGTLFDAMHYASPTRLFETNMDESAIIGHHLIKGTDNKFHPYGELLHLVDKQDFNAPITFTLEGANAMAWYIRQPEHYSKGNNAWEGICLPFQINSVYAFDGSDLSSRGFITHFYGDEVRGHDYWLRGFVGKVDVDGEQRLNFARLGSASGLFNQGEIVGDYDHLNRWLENTYNNSNLNVSYNHGSDGTITTYTDYRYLTANVPYIVSFPGRHYYEYDLSGTFYNEVYDGVAEAAAQAIVYMYRPQPLAADENSCSRAKGAAIGPLTIGVTDDADMTTAVAGYTHHGTFSHIAPGTLLAISDLDDYTPGKTFDIATANILPFRTYMSVPASSLHGRGLVIGESGGDISDPMPEESSDFLTGLNIYLDNNDLVIESDSDLTIPMFDASGRYIRALTVKPGVNRYTRIASGIYMVNTFKFRIH